MRGLIQRVSHALVEVDDQIVGNIDRGILLLLGIEASDTAEQSRKLINKVLNYRIFPEKECSDESGRMNLSVKDIGGGVLVVSQFTLVADTKKGLRPGFSSAAKPDYAERVYAEFVELMRAEHSSVATGIFAADMKVSLCNDGPVTFLLDF
ncbi:MAG: D-tyrosyl-tRNA(Tyr) deacylase [Porticoccaceae bacterium]|nr:D-tyrosyl-tRNA(Tyr) deacylase [Porticoccaceae bacterium]